MKSFQHVLPYIKLDFAAEFQMYLPCRLLCVWAHFSSVKSRRWRASSCLFWLFLSLYRFPGLALPQLFVSPAFDCHCFLFEQSDDSSYLPHKKVHILGFIVPFHLEPRPPRKRQMLVFRVCVISNSLSHVDVPVFYETRTSSHITAKSPIKIAVATFQRYEWCCCTKPKRWNCVLGGRGWVVAPGDALETAGCYTNEELAVFGFSFQFFCAFWSSWSLNMAAGISTVLLAFVAVEPLTVLLTRNDCF